MPVPLIQARDLGKSFRVYERREGLRGLWENLVRRKWRDVEALAGVSLEIEAGEFVGLIGANGAGKTTLVKCLTGIVPASRGDARLFGVDAFQLEPQHKRKLSLVMGQRSQLWWDLPPLDSFRLLQAIYEVPEERFLKRVHGFAERLEVQEQLGIQLRQLSLGQRMKMEIIGAFLHEPEVVFLDEPTIGLDLVSQRTIRAFLVELNREQGVTLVLTSHDMEDIEETCRRLVILESGATLFDGELVELMQHVRGLRSVRIHLEPDSPGWRPELEGELSTLGARLVGEGPSSLSFSVPVEGTRAFVKRLFDLFEVRDMEIERQPLEELVREIFASGSMAAGGTQGAP